VIAAGGSEYRADLVRWPRSSALKACADLAGCPIALDLAAMMLHLHHRPPGKQLGQYAGEGCPLPAGSGGAAAVDGGRPGGLQLDPGSGRMVPVTRVGRSNPA
jgi:hypothetical protein